MKISKEEVKKPKIEKHEKLVWCPSFSFWFV